MAGQATQGSGNTENAVELFQSNLLSELLRSQKEAARFLEFAYLALRDVPEIARQVRSTANDAQNQHLRTHGIVREKQGTALHVVGTMMPLIEMGVKKKKEKLVKKALEKVLTYVDDMVKNTKETVNEYYKIKAAVNDEISNIDEKNRAIKLRESEIKTEMTERRIKFELGKKDLMDLKKKSEQKENDIERMQFKREEFVADSVQSYGIGDNLKDMFTTGMATLGIVFRGPDAGKTIYEGAAVGTKERASRQALEASEKTRQDIEKKQDQVEENERRMARIKEEAVESLVAMERLALECADQMNEDCLKLAGKELGKVEKLLGKLLLFWEDFRAKLYTLSKSHDAIKVLTGFIDDEDLTEDIESSVTHVKGMWNSFGVMCTNYVDESEKQLSELYDFMSKSIDQMAIEECNSRKRELLDRQRAEIRELEKKVI